MTTAISCQGEIDSLWRVRNDQLHFRYTTSCPRDDSQQADGGESLHLMLRPPPMSKILLLAAVLGSCLATALQAQARPTPIREIRGLDFRPTGAWRVLAGRVRARRAQLLAQGAFQSFN